MDKQLRADCESIIESAIKAVLPDAAVRRALEGRRFPGRVILAAIGKAAWRMAYAATKVPGIEIFRGCVITKYGHVMGALPGIDCYEAGHPVPDENTFAATRHLLEMVSDLRESDTVLFLVSGGGSALFELPLIPSEELSAITDALLLRGASIFEMNTVRKHLSAVKGGRFAKCCAPAKVLSIVLSDVLGDRPDVIASGPAAPDPTTSEDALKIAEKYGISLSGNALNAIKEETPFELSNVETVVSGSVRELCAAAKAECEKLGYETTMLTDSLTCTARQAGALLASVAVGHAGDGKKQAFIAGGETVVYVKGSGKGGRNQELALAAAKKIDGLPNVCIFSVGSDGTDGPTDAAGGVVTGNTAQLLRERNISISQFLENNDAYNCLKQIDGLIFTGPTGTNVNDLSVVLIGAPER